MVTKTKCLVIQDWMHNIGLTDKQEKVYALIYGYSQDGMSRMRGTAAGIADWCGCSPRHAQRLIYELENRGLVEHEVVYDKRQRCNITEFWAIVPEDAEAPGKRKKEKINWSGKGRPVYDANVVNQNDTDVVNDYDANVVNRKRVSRYSNISGSCCKNTRRASARKNDDNNDLNLFENSEESGLTAGAPAPLVLPFQEDAFREAWEALLQVPAWKEKDPAALKLILQDLGFVSLSEAVWCVRTVIRKGWRDLIPDQLLAHEDPDNIPHIMTDRESLEVLERLQREGKLTTPAAAQRLDDLRAKMGRAAS